MIFSNIIYRKFMYEIQICILVHRISYVSIGLQLWSNASHSHQYETGIIAWKKRVRHWDQMSCSSSSSCPVLRVMVLRSPPTPPPPPPATGPHPNAVHSQAARERESCPRKGSSAAGTRCCGARAPGYRTRARVRAATSPTPPKPTLETVAAR